MPNPRPDRSDRREPTPGETELMAAIGVGSVEALDRHLDGLLGMQPRPEAERMAAQDESHTADVPWWLIGAGFGVGVAISGVLLALSRRSNT